LNTPLLLVVVELVSLVVLEVELVECLLVLN
jgi:hypothetical protein